MKNLKPSTAAAPKAQKPTRARFETHTEILANAQIHDCCQTYVDAVDPSTRAVIAAAQKRGARLVSIKWITGEFALALCKAGKSAPSSKNIVVAYHACRRIANQTQGTTS